MAAIHAHDAVVTSLQITLASLPAVVTDALKVGGRIPRGSRLYLHTVTVAGTVVATVTIVN